MRALIYKWHRKLALMAGILTLLWVSSGLLHPFMTYWGPRPVAFMPPQTEFSEAPSPQAFEKIMDQLNGTSVTALRLVKAGYDWNWQVKTQDGFSYYDADFGRKNDDFAALYASHLASHYTGRNEADNVTLQQDFDTSYPPINRLLPVYKVTFEGGLTAYVDPVSDRLGAVTDPVRILALWMFQNVHTLSFLDRVELARVALIFLSAATILSMAVLGFALRTSLKYRRQGNAPRRWHGIAAYILWVPVLMMASSGLFHLVMQTPLIKDDPLPQAQAIRLDSSIKIPDIEKFIDLRLAAWKGSPVWRIVREDGVSYIDPYSGRNLNLPEAEWARDLAQASDTEEPVKITTFTDEYGFASKRLPVWRFTDGNKIQFIDPADGLISSTVFPSEVAEQWTFTRLHKWQFLDTLTGKRWRDAAIAAIALSIAGMAITGLLMRVGRRRRSI
jgi:hypothetical protein